MCKKNSEISEWFRKFRNDFESSEWFPSSEWFDLHNNSKHFVIPSTFGIFSKSARNAAETPERRLETTTCGNTHHLHFQHFPRATNYCLICCYFLGGEKVYYFILKFFVERQKKLFLFILRF